MTAARNKPSASQAARDRSNLPPLESGRDFGGKSARAVPADSPVRSASAQPPKAASFFPEASALVEQLAIAPPKFAPLPPPEPQQDRITPRGPQRLSVTPAFVAARPIHESRPNLPLAIRATVISEVEVQIKVQVDESGRVVRIDPLVSTGPVSDSLVSVTEEAARQWRFAPAMRGNRPVESEVVLSFRYTPKTAGN